MFDGIIRCEVMGGDLVFVNEQVERIMLVINTDKYRDDKSTFDHDQFLNWTGMSMDDIRSGLVVYEDSNVTVYFLESM